MRVCRIRGSTHEPRALLSLRAGTTRSVLAALLVVGLAYAGVSGPTTARALAADAADAAAGRKLFSGEVAFRNGGPPCVACHSVGGLGYPNGGTMGPDLTRSFALLGELGMDATLQTLFFPTMMPIFDARPLTPDEQRGLKAFLRQTQSSPQAPDITWELLLIACAGCAGLLLVGGMYWRGRLAGVRRSFVAAARAAEIRE